MALNNLSAPNNLVINQTATLKEAMEAITANQKGAVVVVDDDNTLVGILSDGDVRRGFLREASLITPVQKVMNINFLFLQEGTGESSEAIFQQRSEITILPMVDKQHKLKDVFVR